MDHLFCLSDEAWVATEPHLPRGLPGKPRIENRRVKSGILHVLRTGCRWRDVPAAYGLASAAIRSAWPSAWLTHASTKRPERFAIRP